MKKKTFLSLLALVSFLALWCAPAFALPFLQLDIEGGTYDPVTETIIAQSDVFTLRALLTPHPRDPDPASYLTQPFYISAAVVPPVEPPGDDLGSFSFNGDTIDVTDDMVYGVPPLERFGGNQMHDPVDLSKHGIFETYFTEFEFYFPDNQIVAYNTQEDPGIDWVPYEGSGRMSYLAEFSVDTTGLADGYLIHFDLYNEIVRDAVNGIIPVQDIDRDDFCPFSHDAQSNHIPDPAAVFLLGSACLIGLGGIRGKFHM